MFMMEDMESSTSHSSAKKDLALKASEKAKSKKIDAKQTKVIQVKQRAMMPSLLSS
jgi:hypothetical protein